MLDETDRRFIGLLMLLGSIAVIATFQTTPGPEIGLGLFALSLLWMAQALPHTEHTHEAYAKHNTPLEDTYRGNLTAGSRRPIRPEVALELAARRERARMVALRHESQQSATAD